jgi:RNA polymerase sigma-70 factor (ECF subfamily)
MVTLVFPMTDDSLPTRVSLLSRLRDLADDTSWKEFYERYRRFIFQAALRKGLSSQDAEEVLQGTVVSVARGIPNFVYNPAICSFKGWLMTITRRRVADQLRRRGRQVPLAETAGDIPAGGILVDSPFEAAWEAEWESNLIEAAIDRLRLTISPRNYQIFDWTFRMGRSTQETAAAFGISAGVVRVTKLRVRLQLEKHLRQMRREPWPEGCKP